MKRTAAALALLAAVSDGARAELPKFEIPRLGIFRKKKEDPPATPSQQPQQQMTAEQPKATKLTTVDVLKSDLDEKKRVAASEGLRAVDPRTHPEVMPALMTSLQQDPSASVRASVAETIGKLKPVSAEAGSVLETVVVSDPSDPVRKAAQQALWEYHLNGYRSTSSLGAHPQTSEPPLAKPKTIAPVTPLAKPPVPVVLTSKTPTADVAPTTTPAPRPITTGIGKGAIYPQTIEPPLAKPRTPVAIVPDVKPAAPAAVDIPSIPTPMPVPEKKPEPPAPTPEKKAEPPAIPVPMPAPAPDGIPVPPPAFVPTIPPPPSN